MKRSRLLEYRIKRLERLMYEDAIDCVYNMLF